MELKELSWIVRIWFWWCGLDWSSLWQTHILTVGEEKEKEEWKEEDEEEEEEDKE
jgi:hypothetical protein